MQHATSEAAFRLFAEWFGINPICKRLIGDGQGPSSTTALKVTRSSPWHYTEAEAAM